MILDQSKVPPKLRIILICPVKIICSAGYGMTLTYWLSRARGLGSPKLSQEFFPLLEVEQTQQKQDQAANTHDQAILPYGLLP